MAALALLLEDPKRALTRHPAHRTHTPFSQGQQGLAFPASTGTLTPAIPAQAFEPAVPRPRGPCCWQLSSFGPRVLTACPLCAGPG